MTYEPPSIAELGSVAELTRASGDEYAYDSTLGGLRGLVGFINGEGGSPSGSAA